MPPNRVALDAAQGAAGAETHCTVRYLRKNGAEAYGGFDRLDVLCLSGFYFIICCGHDSVSGIFVYQKKAGK